MAGYREFAQGEVLTAANVNTFLMEQSIMTFEDGTARDAALTDVLREGLTVYNEAVGLHQVYDGAAWVPAGGLVAVKSALFTGTQTNSTTTGANFAVTNLSIAHTLADAANKLVFIASFGAAATSAGRGQVGIAVADDGTLIGVGDAASSRSRVTAGGQSAANVDADIVVMPSVGLVYLPGDAVEHTYTLRAINMRPDTQTIYINRSQSDSNSAAQPRAVSALTLMEVRV